MEEHPLVAMLGELRDKMECPVDRQKVNDVKVAVEESDEISRKVPAQLEGQARDRAQRQRDDLCHRGRYGCALTFKITEKQREAVRLMSGDETHNLLFGGSRSGKTFIIIRVIMIWH